MIGTRWRKSTYTNANGNCVELANTRRSVRDSKNPEPVLNVQVDALLAAISADRIG